MRFWIMVWDEMPPAHPWIVSHLYEQIHMSTFMRTCLYDHAYTTPPRAAPADWMTRNLKERYELFIYYLVVYLYKTKVKSKIDEIRSIEPSIHQLLNQG